MAETGEAQHVSDRGEFEVMHETAEFEGGGVKIDVMPEFCCWFDIRDAWLIRVEFPWMKVNDAGLSLPVEMP